MPVGASDWNFWAQHPDITDDTSTQYQNKKDALRKLNVILADMQSAETAKQAHNAWSEKNRLVRGKPVRVYEGMDFKRKR